MLEFRSDFLSMWHLVPLTIVSDHHGVFKLSLQYDASSFLGVKPASFAFSRPLTFAKCRNGSLLRLFGLVLDTLGPMSISRFPQHQPIRNKDISSKKGPF